MPESLEAVFGYLSPIVHTAASILDIIFISVSRYCVGEERQIHVECWDNACPHSYRAPLGVELGVEDGLENVFRK